MSGLTLRVAFQGEPGAYSEEAVRTHWADAARRGLLEPVPSLSCADVVRMVETGVVDFGLLPIENTLAGSVVATYDALAASRAVTVAAEMVLPIHHCLLALPGAALGDLCTVESHPMALAQCEGFLTGHPGLRALAAYDTAGAAREIAHAGDRTRAAIAGRGAANRFDLAVLACDIEDRTDNQTRFFVIARATPHLAHGAAVRTALVATTANVPGALHALLTPLARAGANLSKLESRPNGEPWSYAFFLEVEHAWDPDAWPRLVHELEEAAASVRVLGTFARGAGRAPARVGEARPVTRETAPDLRVRAIRGATTVATDDAESVHTATTELLGELLARNAIAPDQVVSAIFTATPDLTSTYPARAARDLGWGDVPLLCASEISVAGGLPRCVRVLLHVEGIAAGTRARHVYLRDARALRPDLAAGDNA